MLRPFLVAALTFAAAPTWAAGLFGTVEIANDNLSSFTKWIDVRSRIRQETDRLEACRDNADSCSFSNGKRWNAMMDAAAGKGEQAQMEMVNSFFNGFRYIEDISNYGKTDYWATPTQMMKNSGDCEDYAISKFVSLRMLGWGNSQLRVVILKDTVRQINHAVLAAETGGTDYILDNLASRALPARTVLQYSPYYAVNETTRWIFLKPSRY